ncbi:MAG: hypothetical protein R6V07_20350 [Armatimonadota bacterium]
MKPMAMVFVALMVGLTPMIAAAGSFAVFTEAMEPIPHGSYPLQFSFPLPEGAVTDLSGITVLARQEPTPADLRELERWDDGSLKWVRADAIGTLQGRAPGPQHVLSVTWDSPHSPPDTEPLALAQTDDEVTVRNGVLQVTIGPRGITHLALGDEVLATGDAVRIIDAEGTVYDGFAGTPAVHVRHHGVAAVEVEVVGASDPPFNFKHRYIIHRDSPVIRRRTYIESAEERDVQMVTIGALTLSDDLRDVTARGRDLRTLADPDAAVYWHMTDSMPETWALAEVSGDGEAEVVERFVADPAEDPIHGIEGERTSYFMDVSSESAGVALCGQAREWGRDADLGLAPVDDARELALNAHGMWPRHQAELYARSWRWYEGVAKNFDSAIVVHEGPCDEDTADAIEAAYTDIFAMPDAAWVRSTGVFGWGEDGLEFEPQLEPIRRWVDLAQVSIAEYEQRNRDRFAQRLGGLMSGEIFRGLSSGSGTGGDLNRAMNDTRHWFAEAFRKADGRLLRDAIEIAYAEMDHGMYHVGNPDLVGKNHYHGRWSAVSSGSYGCRSFAALYAYLATGDDYFLDAWQLELEALMRTRSWGSRAGGYTLVSMVWAWERFGEQRYLDKAREIFEYALPRQLADGSTTQGLNETSDLKPWMMGILSEGVLELHRVDPSEEKLGFLRRISDYLVDHQHPDGSWHYIVGSEDPWKQGAATATVAPQLVRVYQLTGDLRYLTAAQRAAVWLFNSASEDTEIVRVRHAPGNTVTGDPSHTATSYIFSLCARISDACHREGLPFVVSARAPLSQDENFGVRGIDELAQGRIALTAAFPEEMGEGALVLGGFAPGAECAATIGGQQTSVTADARGMLTLAIPAGGEVRVAVTGP